MHAFFDKGQLDKLESATFEGFRAYGRRNDQSIRKTVRNRCWLFLSFGLLVFWDRVSWIFLEEWLSGEIGNIFGVRRKTRDELDGLQMR